MSTSQKFSVNQKGLAPISIVILIALALGGYLIYQSQAKPTSPPTTSPTSLPQPTIQPSITSGGFLEGKVTIGPLCPLEPCNLTPQQIAKAYDSRKLLFYHAENQSVLVKEVSIDNQDHFYKVELTPGNYVIKIKSPNILESSRSSKSPMETKIEAGKTNKLDITIDTGIR